MADAPLSDPFAWRGVKAPSLDEMQVIAEEAYRAAAAEISHLCEAW